MFCSKFPTDFNFFLIGSDCSKRADYTLFCSLFLLNSPGIYKNDEILQQITINVPLNSSSSSSSIGTTTLSWVSASSTIVEHSQQEGFIECRCQRHVKPPTWSRTRDLERSNFRYERSPASEATLANSAAAGGTMGEKWQREFCRK
jgi:hypothetical protein